MLLIRLFVATVSLLFITTQAYAGQYIVWGTTLTLYSQGSPESTGHLIESSKGIYSEGNHPWCGKRAYISFDDKAMYAAALAAVSTGRAVNFIYDDASPAKTAAGHQASTCKVISIFY